MGISDPYEIIVICQALSGKDWGGGTEGSRCVKCQDVENRHAKL